MKLISMKKDKYDLIKELMNSLYKKGVYKDFNSSNIMVFDLKSFTFTIAFTSIMEDRNYGMTIFVGHDGLNCLTDMMSLPKEVLFEGDYDNLYVLSYRGKDDLTIQEQMFYDERNIKTKLKNNLSITSYKRGYAPYITTTKEADEIIKALYLVNHVFNLTYDEIKEHFKNKSISGLLVDVNMHKHTFSLHFGGVPRLKEDSLKVVASSEELNYFKELDVSDYSLNIRAHSVCIPVKIKECNKAVTPTIILIGWPFSKFDFDYLISNISEQREQMIIILKEFFKNNGIPSKIVFDNRYYYNALRDIFEQLNVEVTLDLHLESDGFFDDIEDTLYRVFDPVFVDQAFITIPEEEARLSLNAIKKVLLTINTKNPNLECSEEEKETVMAFINTISNSINSLMNDDMANFSDEEEEEIERYTKLKDDLEKNLVS